MEKFDKIRVENVTFSKYFFTPFKVYTNEFQLSERPV